MATLVVDNRERALITELEGLEFRVEQLDVGDIQIRVGEDIVYVIERKTFADLQASIKDGRYREQKHRILENFKADQVMYIIEGYWKEPVDPTVEGAVMHSLIRDRVQVYHTNSVVETARFVRGLVRDWDNHRDAARSEYFVSGNLSTKKKDNMTPQRCYCVMLTCITGVSLNIAKAIQAQYPSFRDLMGANPASLYEIKVNNRRISKKIVEKLLAVLG